MNVDFIYVYMLPTNSMHELELIWLPFYMDSTWF